jgi:hypothetical protein
MLIRPVVLRTASMAVLLAAALAGLQLDAPVPEDRHL